MHGNRLRAWVSERSPGDVVAKIIAIEAGNADPTGTRDPAVRVCRSSLEARGWVEAQAKAFRLEVEWRDGP
jgi:hypothetical protein